MARVTGIGGFFFRAKEPKKLKAWYAEHLGIAGEPIWRQESGFTEFAPFSADTDYFPAEKQAMINFRVDDLDAIIAQLNAANIEVQTSKEWDAPGVGRFARIHDPEGNPIELWEPDENPI